MRAFYENESAAEDNDWDSGSTCDVIAGIPFNEQINMWGFAIGAVYSVRFADGIERNVYGDQLTFLTA